MSMFITTIDQRHMSPLRLLLVWALLLLPMTVSADLSEKYTEKMPLVVVFNRDFPPYEFDNDGTPDGYNVNILEEILKRLNVPYRFITKERYQGGYMFEHFEADIIIDPVHREHGEPFYSSRSILEYYKLRVASSAGSKPITSIDDLKATSGMVLKKNGLATQEIAKRLFPEVKFEPLFVDETLKQIAKGQDKHLLWGEDPLKWKIKRFGLGAKVVLSDYVIYGGEFHIIGHDKELIDLIDDQYARLDQSGELHKMHDQWFHPDRIRSGEFRTIVGLAIIIVVFAVFLGFYNQRIHRREWKANSKADDLRNMMLRALELGDYYIWGYDLKTSRIHNVYGNRLPQDGLTREQFLEHVYPAERAVFLHEVNSLKQNGKGVLEVVQRWKPFKMDNSIVTADWLYLNAHIITEKDHEGKVSKLIGTVKDVTREYEEERSSAELATRFRKLFDSTLVAMSFYAADGQLLDLNENMRKLCRIDVDSDYENFFRNISLFDVPILKGDFNPKGRDNFLVCQRMRYPEIDLDIYIEFRIVPTYEDDKLLYYVVTARDLTGEREMYLQMYKQNRELRLSTEKQNLYERELNYMLENSNIWVWHSNLTEKRVSFSRTLQKNEFNMTFEHFIACLYDDDVPVAMKSFGQMEGLDDSVNVVLHFKKSPVSEKPQWLAISGVPIHDDSGKLTGHFGIVRDVTHLMDAQEQLRLETNRAEDSGKLKSVFLANMTHEIRTPLNAIVGFSDLLQVIDDPEERREFMRIIRNNCDMLIRLINDIIEASNMNQGPLSIENSDVDFAVAFNDICQSLAQRVEEDVEFIVDNPYESFVTKVDKGRLQQVITNFTTNAVKYTHQGHIKVGYSYLSFEELKKKVEGSLNSKEKMPFSGIYMYCEDTGAGIPKDKQTSVFDRFVKLNDYVQGTGLGLSICKSIAERYSGRIGVMSDGEGHGSTFWIWIPCELVSSVRMKEKN